MKEMNGRLEDKMNEQRNEMGGFDLKGYPIWVDSIMQQQVEELGFRQLWEFCSISKLEQGRCNIIIMSSHFHRVCNLL